MGNETYTATTRDYTFEGVTRYTKETLPELVTRVKLGNEKLSKAFDQMKAITPNTERWSAAMEQWHRANLLLKLYCDQLEVLGFLDCLYIKYYEGLTEEEERMVMSELAAGKVFQVKGGVKTVKCLDGLGCRVCPSKKAYWEDELMALPSPGR